MVNFLLLLCLLPQVTTLHLGIDVQTNTSDLVEKWQHLSFQYGFFTLYNFSMILLLNLCRFQTNCTQSNHSKESEETRFVQFWAPNPLQHTLWLPHLKAKVGSQWMQLMFLYFGHQTDPNG